MNINSTSASFTLSANGTKAINNITSASDNLSVSYPLTLSTSTGADGPACNTKYEATRTLGASATETLALRGVLKDGLGDTINFAYVRVLVIKNKSAAARLRLGNATSDSWQGPLSSGATFTLPPGGVFVVVAPGASVFPVASGSSDQLKIENLDASSLTYDIVVVGNG